MGELTSTTLRLLQPALALAAALTVATPVQAQAAPAVAGRWLTKDRSTVIDIEPCAGGLCGRIVGMSDWPAQGVPLDLHGQPECRETIIRDFRAAQPNLWKGDIINPNNGKVYDAELWLGGDTLLHLRGYIGLPLFGQTQVWTRYDGALPEDCHIARAG